MVDDVPGILVDPQSTATTLVEPVEPDEVETRERGDPAATHRLSPPRDHAGFALVLARPAPFLAMPVIWQSDGTSTYSLASPVDLDLS
jgi:hypothetical protein